MEKLLSKDRLGGLFLLIFCSTYAVLIGQINLLPFQASGAFTARTMPEVLSVIGISVAAWITVFPANRETPTFYELNWKLGITFLLLMSCYGLTVRPLGFLLSTSLFLMIGFWLLGEKSFAKLVLVAVPLVVAFWALMTLGLSVFIEPLPAFLRGLSNV